MIGRGGARGAGARGIGYDRAVRIPRAPSIVLGCLVALGGAVRGDGPVKPPDGVVAALEKAAVELAKKNRPTESADVIDLLVRLGRPPASVSAVRAAADKVLAKPGPRAAAAPDVAAPLKRAAADLLPLLAASEGPDKRRVAEVILALDSDVAAAHEALGRVRTGDRWGPPELAKCIAQRAKIAEWVRAAHVLPVAIERGTSDAPALAAIGVKGASVRYGDISVHSRYFPVERMERILRETLRATALYWALHTGKVELPPITSRLAYVAIGNRKNFEVAAREAYEHGGLDDAGYALTKQTGAFIEKRGWTVTEGQIEAHTEASLFHYLFYTFEKADGVDRGQPCLDAGRVEWIGRTYLGTAMPPVAYVETKEKVTEETNSRGTELAVERKRMLRFAEAGIAGTRTWMRWLAAHGEDPAWSMSMVDQIGKISGVVLLKATMVAEYLAETGEYVPLWLATYADRQRPLVELPGVMSAALKQELPAFEDRWRAWLVPPAPGLVQRLGAAPAATVDPTAKAVMSRLDAIRREAIPGFGKDGPPPVSLDTELSNGCRAHARYLAKHPAQAAKWPDAHEEYPDQEGCTAEGAFGGLHSVIAPGVRTAVDALTEWMGTFYHRLPLLDPGLVGIGWGYEKEIAVLDSGSMVAPSEVVTTVVWPAANATGVPLAFVPELPNPVPGERQESWGYPITYQRFVDSSGADVSLVLHVDGAGGAEVDAHLLTPSNAKNPDLAPKDAWCLIPKSPLKPKTRYRVTARPTVGSTYEWTFTTK